MPILPSKSTNYLVTQMFFLKGGVWGKLFLPKKSFPPQAFQAIKYIYPPIDTIFFFATATALRASKSTEPRGLLRVAVKKI